MVMNRRWLEAPYPGFAVRLPSGTHYQAGEDGRFLAWPHDVAGLLVAGCRYLTLSDAGNERYRLELLSVGHPSAIPNLPIELNLTFTLPEVPDAPVAPSSIPSTEEDTPEHG